MAIPGQSITIPITTFTTVTTVNNNSTTKLVFNNTGQAPTPVTTTTTTSSTQTIPTTTFITRPVFTTVSGFPITGQYSASAISDDESPRPVDRAFLSFNYFSDISRSTIPASIPSINVERQLVGFEKTCLSGDASVGIRLPFLQFNGFSEVDDYSIGDLSIVLKFAWLNDRQTGDILSSGVVVTVPTGTVNVQLADGSVAPHAALIQPWGGFIYNLKQVFFQGFSSVTLPTDQRDPTLWLNTLAAGCWLYKKRRRGVLELDRAGGRTPSEHAAQPSLDR